MSATRVVQLGDGAATPVAQLERLLQTPVQIAAADHCPGAVMVSWVCIHSGPGRGCHRLRTHVCVDGQTYDLDAQHEQLALL